LLAALQHQHSCGDQDQHNNAAHTDLERRFSKIDLRNAEVISQVDRKFIACLIDDSSGDVGKPCDSRIEAYDKGRSGKALVLIDQHAADERIRVERLLRELCIGYLRTEGDGVKRKELSPSLPVLLTRHEASRLTESDQIRKVFDAWGVRFAGDLGQKSAAHDEERPETNDGGYVQIMVSSVPEVVCEKVWLLPTVLKASHNRLHS
jgi:DNA mismatch repair protein MLH3